MPVTATFTTAGALRSLGADGLSLLQYPASELEAGPANLWLRERGAGATSAHPLTGPASGSTCLGDTVRGGFGDLAYEAWFDVVGDGFCWQWRVRNTGVRRISADVVFTCDVALTAWDDLRRNEYYVSQYLDLTPLTVGAPGLSEGTCLAVRQNMPGSGHPWLGLASLTGTAGWVTDAVQLRDPAGGLDLSRDLPGRRWQHEHTLAGLQAPPVTLAPGETARGGFVGVFQRSHAEASGPADAAAIEAFVAAAPWRPEPPVGDGDEAVGTIFSPRRALAVTPGTIPDTYGDEPVRLAETAPDGSAWSAFAGDAHLVTTAKERAVLRPHGHVLHAGPGATAGAGHIASTAWMAGVFCSQLTHDHASGAPATTLRRSYLGLSEAGGVRVAVWHAGAWRLLAQPSLWVQRRHSCRWVYDAGGFTVTVDATVALDGTRLAVTCSAPVDVLVAVPLDHEGVDLTSSTGALGDDGPLFADGASRGLRWRTLLVEAATRLDVGLTVASDPGPAFDWRLPALASDAPGVAELQAVLPWFVHDAAVHFQAPRGLEQFTGGAWGTRDVAQGPVGLLLAAGEHAALRDTLLAVFAAQHPDGDWPQWFDYLESHVAPEARESHGDVVYWPLLALGEYLLVTGDASILDERVRFVGASALLAPEPVRTHVARAVERLASRRTRDPRLPAYGHGDWNDSLQPARTELAEQMCSAWTSVLEVEALGTLADGLADDVLSPKLRALCAQTASALREVLLVDGELAGYAILREDGTELLVHPRDASTGLVHGSLQVIHALAGGLLTPAEAARHVALVDEHLQGPHGIYLFSTPIAYHGGVLETFLRAEAATFWGREIGLMYTHAHLRWVEALTVLGDAPRAWAELLRVVPVGLPDRSTGARPRQATCYYSSADALFTDRYEAQEHADALFDGATPFEGGWRVYSSGPGLVLRLLTERVLGVRFRAAGVEVDPVLPPALDGLVARIPTPGTGFAEVTYHVGTAGCGVRRVAVDGAEATGSPLRARYRDPGWVLAPDAVGPGSRVEVWLG